MKMQGALKKFPEVFKITKMETNTLVKGKWKCRLPGHTFPRRFKKTVQSRECKTLSTSTDIWSVKNRRDIKKTKKFSPYSPRKRHGRKRHGHKHHGFYQFGLSRKKNKKFSPYSSWKRHEYVTDINITGFTKFDRHGCLNVTGFYQHPTPTIIAIIYLLFLHIEDTPIFSFQERFGSQRQFLIDALRDAISIYLFSVSLALNWWMHLS